jgi:hypothetical protein
MPEPIRPGIKKAVTPNIGITAFYIKSQLCARPLLGGVRCIVSNFYIKSQHALFLYIYGIRRSITQTYNFQAFVGGVHKLYEPGGSLCPPVLGNCNV